MLLIKAEAERLQYKRQIQVFRNTPTRTTPLASLIKHEIRAANRNAATHGMVSAHVGVILRVYHDN